MKVEIFSGKNCKTILVEMTYLPQKGDFIALSDANASLLGYDEEIVEVIARTFIVNEGVRLILGK